MTGRRKICLTFVGDITKDSRATRFIRTLSEEFEIHVVTLHHRALQFEYCGAHVQQLAMADEESLRFSLHAFWMEGTSLATSLAADAYIASDLYSLPVAGRASKAIGTKLIYDSRELYTSIAALKHRTIVQRFWNLVERHYARNAWAITTVNAAIGKLVAERFRDIPVHVLKNYPNEIVSESSNRIRETLAIPADEIILLSQGGLQVGRGAILAVNAIRYFDNSHLVFLGDGILTSEVFLEAQRFGIEQRVHHIPAVPSIDVLPWTASADIGLCIIENYGESYYNSLPNKLFEYIVAGVPVIGSAFPEIASVITGYGVGLTVNPESEHELVAAIRSMLNEESRAKHRHRCIEVRTNFLWEREREKFLHLIHSIPTSR